MFKLLYHILFWGLSFLLCSFLMSYNNNWNEAFLLSSIYMPITIGLAYTISYYLIPQFLLKGKKFRFALYSIYTFIIAEFITLTLNTIIFIFIANYQYDLMPPATQDFAILNTVLFLIVMLFLAITSIDKWRATDTEKNEALKNMAEAELKFLKSQLNPHFLFNTMNNLYALSLKKSDKAPELILRLSALLEYILENSKKNLVRLSDEVKVLEDYIYIESFRFGDRLKIHQELNVGNQNEIQIPPLLLITLMENCFKHGGKNNSDELIINYMIEVIESKNKISFSNNFVSSESNSQAIGLKNIKSQLAYLYKSQYKMSHMITGNIFKIEIELPCQ